MTLHNSSSRTYIQAFKSDSQRLAFLVPSLGFVFMAVWPSDDLVYLLEDISTGRPIVRPDGEIIEKLNVVSSPIIICGHTHTPRCVELSTGQIVINPGSVGLQAYTDDEPNVHSMQNYSPKASYATLQKASEDKWDIVFIR